eukprot:14622344-Alexandrium_andersonii.AAC.1
MEEGEVGVDAADHEQGPQAPDAWNESEGAHYHGPAAQAAGSGVWGPVPAGLTGPHLACQLQRLRMD